MTIVGIDPSTKKIAFAGSEVDGSNPWVWVAPLLGKSDPYSPLKANLAFGATEKVLRNHKVKHVFVESPLLGVGGVKTALLLGYIGGAIHAGAVRAGAEVHIVNVQSWKKTLGKGSFSKAEVGEAVLKTLPEMHSMAAGDQDLLDAIGILYHARLNV